VPKAKYPAIDVHGHPPALTSADTLKRVVDAMDSLNLGVMVAANDLSGDRLVETVAAINASPYKNRFRVLAGIDFRDVGPGWGERAVKQLEADIKAGAVGVGDGPHDREAEAGARPAGVALEALEALASTLEAMRRAETARSFSGEANPEEGTHATPIPPIPTSIRSGAAQPAAGQQEHSAGGADDPGAPRDVGGAAAGCGKHDAGRLTR